MKLKDKFLELLKDYNPAFKNTESKGCEKIADDFAIGFAEWLSDWHTKERLKELLEIYKKEKGL